MAQYYINDQVAGLGGGNNGGVGIDAWISIADMALPIGTHTVEFVAGSGPYYEQFLLDRNSTTFNGNGVKVRGGVDINAISGGEWHPSSKDGEWYFTGAGGADPLLTQPQAGTVDKYYCGSSAEASRQLGTGGALTFDKQFGWGNYLSEAGFNTLYVKLGTDPSLYEIIIGSMDWIIDTGWNDNVFNDFHFEYSNLGACRARSGYIFNDCTFKYMDDTGVDMNVSGTTTLNRCIGFWCGHRLVATSTAGANFITNHCISVESHLYALFNTGSTGTFTILNSIQYGGEAAAIDKKTTASTLIERGNLWFPRMTAASGSLGYVSQANWPTTNFSDFPSGVASSESDQANLTDPMFVNIDLDDFDNCDFHLQDGSPCRNSGVILDAPILDKDGVAYDDTFPSIGVYSYAFTKSGRYPAIRSRTTVSRT